MGGVRIKKGDVFSVALNDTNKRCFQYIADDLAQLNSQVIKGFKKRYGINDEVNLQEAVKDEVDFHAHVFLRTGLRLGFWQKIGSVFEVGVCDALFRCSDDYGNPKIKISKDWRIWKINEPFVRVGKLEGKNTKAEIGIVFSPDVILERMQTGKFNLVYPGF